MPDPKPDEPPPPKDPAAPEPVGPLTTGELRVEISRGERLAELRAVGSKLLKDPIGGAVQGVQQVVGGAKQVVGAMRTRRGVALGWAAALLVSVLCYILDLGAGSVWNGDDALVAL